MRQRKSVLPSFMDPKHIIKQDEELPTVTAVPLSLDSPTTGNASRRVYEVEMQPLHQHKDESERSNDDYHQIDELMYPVRILRPKGSWEHRVQDFLFPPHVPRECQLLRPENIAVPLTYLLVGLLQGLSSPLINVFPLDLRATEAAMTTISGIRSLPACFKILFGFISDTSPILGYRRKPYMMIGWLLASFSILCILVFSNTHVPPRNSGFFGTDADEESSSASEENKIPEDAPSIPFLALSLLGFGTGFWMADVMGDSIVAEKAKLEPPESRGSVQSSCYSYRFFGVMVAAPLSSYIYSAAGPTYVFYILAFMPLTILPFIYLLAEQRDRPVASVKEQCQEIWGTVCSRAVWQPMGFVFLFNAMQVGNGAWREFQTVVLKFTSFQLNIFLIVAYILLYFGVLTYKYFMMGWSWRKVYIFTTFLNAFFSVLQVLLIYGITFGLPSFWFALGDDVFSDFIEGVQVRMTKFRVAFPCIVLSNANHPSFFQQLS